MPRLVFAPLFLIVLASPAWAQSSSNLGSGLQRATEPNPPEISHRDFTVSATEWGESEDRIPISTEIGPNLSAGLGMFGHKRDKGYQRPVTGRELDMPKSRRAGVGLSLKF